MARGSHSCEFNSRRWIGTHARPRVSKSGRENIYMYIFSRCELAPNPRVVQPRREMRANYVTPRRIRARSESRFCVFTGAGNAELSYGNFLTFDRTPFLRDKATVDTARLQEGRTRPSPRSFLPSSMRYDSLGVGGPEIYDACLARARLVFAGVGGKLTRDREKRRREARLSHGLFFVAAYFISPRLSAASSARNPLLPSRFVNGERHCGFCDETPEGRILISDKRISARSTEKEGEPKDRAIATHRKKRDRGADTRGRGIRRIQALVDRDFPTCA